MAGPWVPPAVDWHNPRKLYAEGFPEGLTTALEVFGALRMRLREIVRELAPDFVLEVGPGTRPVLEPGPGRCFFDVSHWILERLGGQRVEGDIRRAPFADGMFDLVVASDVITHVRPEEWPLALGEMLRLAPKLLLFNPEPGAQRYLAPPVESRKVVALLRELGARPQAWPVDMLTDRGGRYRFSLIMVEAGEGA